MMILILRSSVVNKLTMTSYKELSLALTIEEPQKHRAPWLGALLSYMAEEVRFELTEDFHPRQFSRLVHSTALPLFHLRFQP